jgi:hypothetical protein
VQDGAVCPNPKFAEKPATRAAPKAKASKAPVSNPFNQWLVEDEDDKLGDQFGADTGDYDGEFADWE